jgi:hypothetical protein
MGLSVSVYKNIKPCSDEDANFVAYVASENWKWKVKNLIYNQAYEGEFIENVGIDCGYGFHGLFRGFLLSIAGRQDLLCEDGKVDYEKIYTENSLPFFDLIDFADNEGCLDWEVSEKILSDFDLYAEKAKKSDNAVMSERYEKWHDIFKAAVEHKGVVEFS